MKMIPKSQEDSGTIISSGDMTPYDSDFAYLFDELYRINLLISCYLKKFTEEHHEYMDEFRGLYITEDEVSAILQTPLTELKKDGNSDLEQENIDAITRKINQNKSDTINNGKALRLNTLSEIFNLQPFEVDILLIALAPELDIRYEKLYSYLQNDVTKKWPRVDMAINLLLHAPEERLKARKYFSSNAPLIKHGLIYLMDNDPYVQSNLLSKFIKVDKRITDYLLGFDEVDSRIWKFSAVLEPKRSIRDLISDDNKKTTLKELIRWHSRTKVPVMFYFHGAYGTGKKMTAEAVCRELGTSLFAVDSRALTGAESFETLILILREAVLQNSSLFLEGFDILLKDETTAIDVNTMLRELDSRTHWIFLSGEHPWEPQRILKNHRYISYAFPMPDFLHRKQLWESFLHHRNLSDDVDICTLAGKFNLSGGQIQDSIYTAHNIAMATKPGLTTLSMSDLNQGCRAQSNRELASLTNKIEPSHIWKDIVLPTDIKEQLKEVSGYIKYKGTVYNDWGFDKKLSLGKGLNVLFSGPSGTGKTMAAEIMAGEVGLDLYKIDLSGVVSKYIGETEKNLKKIFKEAQTSNAILFFDEADALFGKRSEVRDSHDRYANIEINYLLQKMEEHDGIVILASNFKKNMDEAFLRRLHFTVEFPLPDKELREKIWRNIFPGQTPIEEDVDFTFLANFKITGGNIKNIALSAAFLAAGDSLIVTMEHIIKSTKREFQKMGKLCTPGDFGKYYELVI